MTALYLSRFRLDLPRLFAWAAAENLPLDNGDIGYTVHCALRMALQEDGPQPFAVHQLKHDWDREETVVYGYGPADEERLRNRLADPRDPRAAEALGALEVKAMPERWPPGQILHFSTRICPVVRQDRDGDRTRSRETDVFLAAADGHSPQERPLDRETLYRDWLRGELSRDGAADIVEARMTAFRRTRIHRRTAGKSTKPDAGFEGRLTVGDAEAFQRLLTRGLGRHRAFGFGMLLLKPG